MGMLHRECCAGGVVLGDVAKGVAWECCTGDVAQEVLSWGMLHRVLHEGCFKGGLRVCLGTHIFFKFYSRNYGYIEDLSEIGLQPI